jgi:hypothetical protein
MGSGKGSGICCVKKEKWEGKQEKGRGMDSEMSIVNVKLSCAFLSLSTVSNFDLR